MQVILYCSVTIYVLCSDFTQSYVHKLSYGRYVHMWFEVGMFVGWVEHFFAWAERQKKSTSRWGIILFGLVASANLTQKW